VLGIEHEHVIVLTVGDEKPVAIIDNQAENAAELGVDAMLDKTGIFAFGVEDKNCSHLGIGHVQQSLGVDCEPVGSSELVARLGAGALSSISRVDAGHAVHPRFLLDLGFLFLRILFLSGKIIQVPEPRDGRRLRPNDVGNIDFWRLWRLGRRGRFLLISECRGDPSGG
jgi:hypothetical protein